MGPIGALACVAALAAQFDHVDALDRVALPLLAALLVVMIGVLAFNLLSVTLAAPIRVARNSYSCCRVCPNGEARRWPRPPGRTCTSTSSIRSVA